MSKNKKTKQSLPNAESDPYKNEICDDSMSFEDCELAIVRNAIEANEEAQEELQKEKIKIDENITRIFQILETYIIRKKLVLYGGFAINAVLPEYDKFYDAKHEIPDYDVYSPNALEDAIELADFFIANGYTDVEAKAGVHYMTYKIYVNFIAIADVTMLERTIFENLQKEAIIINRLYYCPVNFLRREIYKELSQPQGNVSRWEKIYKRLNKINENYPLILSTKCEDLEFQRQMVSVEEDESEVIYEIVKNALIYLGAVFFGGYACSLYTQYMPDDSRKVIEKIPDFDVLYEDIEKGGRIIKEKLNLAGFTRVKLVYHSSKGEVIPECYEIQVNEDTIAFIYKPNACFSYNIVNLNKQQIKVASIDTMLFFCYSFYYSSQPFHSRERILCTIKILSDVEVNNRLNQKGLLKRFSTECIGEHLSMMQIKEKKAEKFKELVKKRHTREYFEWFLKYNPFIQPRPAFMRKRNSRFPRVRFSKKNPRYGRPSSFMNTRPQTNRGILKTSIKIPEEIPTHKEENTRRYDTIEETPAHKKRNAQVYDTIEETPLEDSQVYDTIHESSWRKDTPFTNETREEDVTDSIKQEYPVARRKHMVNKGKNTRKHMKYNHHEKHDDGDGMNRKEYWVDKKGNIKKHDMANERITGANSAGDDRIFRSVTKENVREKEDKKRRKKQKQTESYAKKMFDLQKLFGYKKLNTRKAKKGVF